MTRLPRTLILALLALGIPTDSLAGLNAGAVAKLYWLTGANAKAAYRDETGCTPKLMVTASGLHNFRGANVQIQLGSDSGALPPSWQFQSGGCASAGQATLARSGFATGVPSAWDGATGVADAQSAMYFNFSTCLTPNGIAVIWLQSAGVSGVNKSPTTEYGLYVVSVDQSSSACAGSCADSAGPAGVCFNLFLKDPCPKTTTSGVFIQVLDGNLDVDNCPVTAGFSFLAWNSASNDISQMSGKCYIAGAVRSTTWGQLRKSYR